MNEGWNLRGRAMKLMPRDDRRRVNESMCDLEMVEV